jgi:glycosyltransferase involved in cell wall biosynthesis
MSIDVLFIHSNFPAQFRNLAQHLAAQPEFRIKAIGSRSAAALPGVDLKRYSFALGRSAAIHTFARRFEQECRRAEQVMYVANGLKADGFDPALIYVHPGWGESLPLRSLFPRARICIYAEFYYRRHGADVGFDPEFGRLGVDGETRVALRNAASLLAFADADVAITPTNWQRSVHPSEFQSKIRVIHDGVDTDALQPQEDWALGRDEEVVTYVARNLEPYRGFHSFMRALPYLQRARPKAQVHIVGGDRVSYGNRPVGYKTWREAMLAEVGSQLDLSRVHFTGTLAYDDYLALLRRSSAHVYLTYPFVLSWSMLEAMALGCHVIGSDTPSVREVLEDDVNGTLVPFADPHAIAGRIADSLARPRQFRRHREAARRTVIERFDLRQVVLPAQRALITEYIPDAFVAPLQLAEERRPSRYSGSETARMLHPV